MPTRAADAAGDCELRRSAMSRSSRVVIFTLPGSPSTIAHSMAGAFGEGCLVGPIDARAAQFDGGTRAPSRLKACGVCAR